MEDNNVKTDNETPIITNVDNDELEESELEDVLESVPPEHRKVIERIMISSSMQMRSIASPEANVMKKLTSEHISKYLDGAELEMKNSYTEKFHKKIFSLLSMTIAMVFFIAIIILLKDSPVVMEKIIYTVAGVVAGAFGGYGFGKKRND